MAEVAPTRPGAGMHRFTVALAGATLVLLFAGGMVTSTGSGLATGDWPLPEGRILPPMVGEMLFEHGHRLIASAVGLMTVVLAVWLILREPRRWVRGLGLVAVATVAAQGLLGMLTVRLELPAAVSIAHAGLSQIFFGLVVSVAVVTSRGWTERRGRIGDPGAFHAGEVLVAATYVQILLGAVVRHTGTFVWLHVLGAAVLVAAIAVAAHLASREPNLRGPGGGLIALVAAQMLLGVGSLTIATGGLARSIEAPIANAVVLSLHLVAGALMLGTALTLTLRAGRALAVVAPTPEPEGAAS